MALIKMVQRWRLARQHDRRRRQREAEKLALWRYYIRETTR